MVALGMVVQEQMFPVIFLIVAMIVKTLVVPG